MTCIHFLQAQVSEPQLMIKRKKFPTGRNCVRVWLEKGGVLWAPMLHGWSGHENRSIKRERKKKNENKPNRPDRTARQTWKSFHEFQFVDFSLILPPACHLTEIAMHIPTMFSSVEHEAVYSFYTCPLRFCVTYQKIIDQFCAQDAFFCKMHYFSHLQREATQLCYLTDLVCMWSYLNKTVFCDIWS